jgi:hypothetical protein
LIAFPDLHPDLQATITAPGRQDNIVNLLLCWDSPSTPELSHVSADAMIQLIPCNNIKLIGNVLRTDNGVFITPASLHQQKEMEWMHPATVFAREHDLDIVMTPLSLFNDKTSGKISKQFNKYESSCITFSNMPCKKCFQNKNLYILLTLNGLLAMEQLDVIAEELLEMANGVIGIDGATGCRAIVVSPVAAFLGNNTRQADLCSHRGMVAHANCRFCIRDCQKQS